MKTISVSDQLADALVAAQLASFVGMATAAAPAAVPAVTNDDGWPRILEFGGLGPENIKVMADETINWQWRPSMSDIMYGQQGRILSDPSNGKRVNMPLRSPQNFPLVYAVAPDGNGGNVAVGTPAVAYADSTFNSDAEVFDYIARVAGAGTAGDQGATVYPQVDGHTVPAASLSGDDFNVVYLMNNQFPRWAFRHLSGTQSEINGAIVRFGNDPSAAMAWANAGGLASYAGALKPWVNAA